MDEAFAAILRALDLPTSAVLAIAAVAIVASLFAGRFPIWLRPFISALRAGAIAALRKPAQLAVTKAAQKAPEPEPAEPPPSSFSDNVQTGISDEDRPPG